MLKPVLLASSIKEQYIQKRLAATTAHFRILMCVAHAYLTMPSLMAMFSFLGFNKITSIALFISRACQQS